jgi:hypothetical protein
MMLIFLFLTSCHFAREQPAATRSLCSLEYPATVRFVSKA